MPPGVRSLARKKKLRAQQVREAQRRRRERLKSGNLGFLQLILPDALRTELQAVSVDKNKTMQEMALALIACGLGKESMADALPPRRPRGKKILSPAAHPEPAAPVPEPETTAPETSLAPSAPPEPLPPPAEPSPAESLEPVAEVSAPERISSPPKTPVPPPEIAAEVKKKPRKSSRQSDDQMELF